MTNERLTQEARVFAALRNADGGWVNGGYFLHTMMLSQYHRAIWNLEHRDGVAIEHSTFKDSHGFLSYRLRAPVPVAPPAPTFVAQCQGQVAMFSMKAPAN